MSSSFEEDFRKSQFNEDDEEENTQSLRPARNLNPDSSLNPSHPFAWSEESSLTKAQFTSLGGSSLLMRAALNHRQNRDSSLTNTEHIISQKESNTIQETSQTKEKEEDKDNLILEALSYIWVTVIGEWNNEQEDPFQTLVNTVGGFIPVVDQVLDLRDLTAHLYYMVFEKDYKDPMRWLGLGLTAIGAIPFVGSLVKGLGKLALSSDAAKAVGKYAEPLLEQIKQINPEWADIGKLKAAIDENWEAGVAASKQAWMDLLAGVKGKVSKIPLLPSWFWGADKLKSAKLELLETITEIQSLSHTMLDEALDKIKSEIDIILKELDRIAKEKLGQPELVPETVGDKVGAYNRTSVEPPQRNEPMLSVGSSSSSVPPSMKGIRSIEFKRLSEIAANRGLKSDLVTNLYDDLGEKAVKDLLTKSDDEIAAAMRSVELERIDAGHSVDRHGPQVKDIELENRLKTGIAPDGVFSPAPASTRFSDFDSWVKTRDIALKEIEKKYGIDLSKPPAPGTIGQYDILTEYNRPIDEGFVGDITTKKKVVDPTNPKKKGKAFTSITPVDGITRTKTVIRWDGTAWKTKQHIPWAMDWDDATKTYSQPADSYVTLP